MESRAEVAAIMKGLTVEVRGLFDQMQSPVRLLLVFPVSSAEADRSFSDLETWLRSIMTQVRLNNRAVCRVHQEKVDNTDLTEICQRFISSTHRHTNVFGSFKYEQPVNTNLLVFEYFDKLLI